MASLAIPGSGFIFPDGSASNLSASLQVGKGTGAAPATFWIEAAFPDVTTTGIIVPFELPPEAATGLTAIKLFWKANATTGAVRWSVQVAAWSNTATTALPAHVFAAANLATGTTGATTARQINTTSVTLATADSMAPGQMGEILVQRLGGDAADTLTVAAELFAVEITYT